MSNERGRPRGFDEDAVLDRALQVFWQRGFQGASLAELTDAMGLNKPSLYAAFGDKEALYLRCLERYLAREIANRVQVLDTEPDARVAVDKFLRGMAAMLSDPLLPGGCFIVNGTADCGVPSVPDAIEQALRTALRGSETKLRERMLRAQRDAQLPADLKAAELAGVLAALLAGMAVMAKSGAKRAKLNQVIATTMTLWPEPPSM